KNYKLVMKHIFLPLIALLFSLTAISQDVIMQNGTSSQCSGTFYDSGGATGDYGNGESFIYTICPENPGQQAQIDFITFSTQLNADIMTIYDGPDTASPAFGVCSGGGPGNNPGLVTATLSNLSGCLTIEFVSDCSVATTGWVATLIYLRSCLTIV